MNEAELSVNTLFGGSLRVAQPRKGYRFSIDSVLLANFVRLRPGERVLDIGTGCGIIPLYLAKKGHANEMVGVEIQRSLYRSALANRELNGLPNVEFLEGDIRELQSELRKRPFHVIVSNPPYTKVRSGRKSPHISRLLARYELELDLSTLLSLSSSLLVRKGRLYVIYPALRSSEFIAEARQAKLEPKRLRFVHSREDERACMFLVECVKEAGPGTIVEAPLYVYGDSTYTEEVESYYRV